MTSSPPITDTLTFLFTDIEGSTRLWQQYPQAMQTSLALHDQILHQAIQSCNGKVFKTIGDAFFAVFETAPDALQAALISQRILHNTSWGETGALKVRMAIDTGLVEKRNGDYFGTPLNRAQRLISAGHGGQVLISAATHELLQDNLPPSVSLRDLGLRRLKDLLHPERIYQLSVPDLPTNFPALKTLDQRPSNLPAPTTSFWGRQTEINEGCDLLRRPEIRLLTLTGPGGTGKTRLSLQIASRLLDDFEDGIFFVPLAAIFDPALVLPTIAQALDVKEISGQSLIQALTIHLQNRQLLLVLDNFEQIVAAAVQIAQLLKNTTRLKILVSSRETLHIYGEHEYPVPPLPLPDLRRLPPLDTLAEYPAIALFVERARNTRPDFDLTTQNAAAIAEICTRLDGLPLALELAAARIRMLTPREMLTRLSNRLNLLNSGARDLTERQRTLRGAITWSYDLLTEEEKTIFNRLSAFFNGCDFESAEFVCTRNNTDSLDLFTGIESLLEKSLLRREIGPNGTARFTMLETIREYAYEKLQESGSLPELRALHAQYFIQLSAQAKDSLLMGPEQPNWLRRLEQEHDNLRGALAWTLEDPTRAEQAVTLGAALWRFWWTRGYLGEGRRWMQRIITHAAHLQTTTLADAIHGTAMLTWDQGDHIPAIRLYEQCLQLSRQLHYIAGMARSLDALGYAADTHEDYAQAIAYFEESLPLKRQTNNDWEVACTLNNMGYVHTHQANFEEAIRLFDESLVLFRKTGDQWGIGMALARIGEAARAQGDLAKARHYLQQGLEIWESMGNRRDVPILKVAIAEFDLRENNIAAALPAFRNILPLALEQDQPAAIYPALIGIAACLQTTQPQTAAQLFGFIETHWRGICLTLPPNEVEIYDYYLPPARAALQHNPLTADYWHSGANLTLEQASQLALKGE